jgi:diguanylate cyclase (GGDEF)-like protein
MRVAMVADKAKWGLFLFLAAPVMLGGAYYFSLAIPVYTYPLVYVKVIPAIGLVVSIFALFFGHFSYSRIHGVRMYFAGYTVGIMGILYFLLCSRVAPLPPQLVPVMPGYAELLFCLLLADLCVVTLIPPASKYRFLRSVTLSVVGIEALVLVIFRFSAGASSWVQPFFPDRMVEPLFWLLPLLFIGAVLLSVARVQREFFLGGIVAGGGLILFSAWLPSATGMVYAENYQTLAMAGLSLYFSAGIVMHGFFRMEHRIAYDPLLKIYNRDYCSKIITEQANLDVAPPFGVAMVDIDHFKQVNDTHGHQAGDAVLHTVAKAVERGAGEDGIACRYGGEELAVFFPRRTSKEVAEIGEGIRRDIEKIRTKSGRKTIQVTVSIGVSHRETYDQSIVEVIHAADKALYAAKNGGRNQIKIQKTHDKDARK